MNTTRHMNTTSTDTLKVKSASNAKKVAGALARSIQAHPKVRLVAIGAGAVNQAVKAVAIASGFIKPKGLNLYAEVAFSTILIDGKEKTAVHLITSTIEHDEVKLDSDLSALSNLKVGANSNPKSVASALAHSVQKIPKVKLTAIGPAAVNQAAKAVAIASGYIKPKGLNVKFQVSFTTVVIENMEKTALQYSVMPIDS